ncbi:MAG: universal stress protein [Sandaracinaceae bacterium]
MTDTIICPTDYSEASERALELAVRHLADGDAEVHLLHVDDLPTYGLATGSALDDPLRAHWRDSEGRLLETYGREARVHVATRHGRPAKEIIAYAEDVGASLIVMATRGRPALSRAFLGSVADKVVRTSSVPVITVDPDASVGAVRRILCAVDFSSCSEVALREATRLAARRGARVHLIHVCELVGSYTFPDGTTYYDAQLDAALRADARRDMDALRARFDAEVVVSGEIESGIVHEGIAAYASETGVDLIVVGTHGRTGMNRVVLGSVAERVIRTARVPVMVVPIADDAIAGS